MLRETPLIAWTEKGLYCAAGDFFIDPHRGVKNAVLTHAHSDHARRGSEKYFCEQSSVGLVKARLGKAISIQGVPYGEALRFGEVRVSFHSAGHILGSAQVRVEYRGEVWVASGDYKRDSDPSCAAFEPVRCETFITEATFGTPKYVWQKSQSHGRDIHDWWMKNAATLTNSLLFGYSLGKAQRILAELAPFAERPVLIHSTMTELTQCYRDEGRTLAPTVEIAEALRAHGTAPLTGELILAPPSVLDETWALRLGNYKTAFASGWMQGSSRHYGNAYDHGFVISDHADWNDLNRTIDETGATRVFVQHRNGALVRHLRERGLDAHPIEALAPENFKRIPAQNLSLF